MQMATRRLSRHEMCSKTVCGAQLCRHGRFWPVDTGDRRKSALTHPFHRPLP